MQMYYIDLVESEVALQCWRQFTKQLSNDQAELMLETKDVALPDAEVFDEFDSDDDDESDESQDEESGQTTRRSTLSQASSNHKRTDYNILVLGATECGKSALVSRFMDD